MSQRSIGNLSVLSKVDTSTNLQRSKLSKSKYESETTVNELTLPKIKTTKFLGNSLQAELGMAKIVNEL